MVHMSFVGFLSSVPACLAGSLPVIHYIKSKNSNTCNYFKLFLQIIAFKAAGAGVALTTIALTSLDKEHQKYEVDERLLKIAATTLFGSLTAVALEQTIQ